MEVTRPLLLVPFYLVKWPVNPNILAASVDFMHFLTSYPTFIPLRFQMIDITSSSDANTNPESTNPDFFHKTNFVYLSLCTANVNNNIHFCEKN